VIKSPANSPELNSMVWAALKDFLRKKLCKNKDVIVIDI
jgi:hypothetical protein